MTNNKTSITDIANKSGLSTTTVSRVLNGKAEQYRISNKSQEIIKKIAEELNYMPNQFAANLRTGKSNTIALIVPTLSNPFFAEIANRINRELRNGGYMTIIADSNEDQEIEKEELRNLVSRNIEGLIIVPTGNQWIHIKNLYDQGLPMICVDRYLEEFDMPFVSTDNYDGSLTATNTLIDYGHKNIACIQGVHHSSTNKSRLKGFLDAVKNVEGVDYTILGDDFTIQNGYLETKLILQQERRPTAIFAFSNTIAIGCLKALKEDGLRVPEDISIITFDDHPYLDYLATPLSCIAQPVKNISKIAVKLLFSLMENKEIFTKKIFLKSELKIKESVKRIV